MTKGCYTCRRRRIICDNGQPTCRKCRDAGKECLGYQKPLVWVKGGVASRGKMMGRSFDEVNQPGTEPEHDQRPAESHDIPASNSGFGSFSAVDFSSDADLSNPAVHTIPDSWAPDSIENLEFEPITTGDALSGSNKPVDTSTEVIHAPRGTRVDYIPAPWGLVDPLIKDLSQLSRFYLFHCMSSYPVRQPFI